MLPQGPAPGQGRRLDGDRPGPASAEHPAIARLFEKVGVEVGAQVDHVRLPNRRVGLHAGRDHIVVAGLEPEGGHRQQTAEHRSGEHDPPVGHWLHQGSRCWRPWPSNRQ